MNLLLLLLNLFLTCMSISPPECSDGSESVCTGGGGLAAKYLKPAPKRPCNPGRPACEDKTPPLNLKCSGGGSPTAQVGSYPQCASGNLVCQNEQPLRCLV